MLLAVRISSYGCTREVWRALRKLELHSATHLSCSPNFPRASITRYTHAKHEQILKFSICLRLSHRYEFMYAAIFPCVNKPCSMFFKNLPLNFSFAESTVLRLQLNCKTFFVVILNGICLPALNIRVKTLRENYSCNYKHQLKRL